MLIGNFIGIPYAVKTVKRIIVFDDFNRADNANTLGNALTGQSWEAVFGVWGISGNKMKAMSNVNGTNKVVINAKTGDCVIECEVNRVSGSGFYQRFNFRYVDPQNEWLLGGTSVDNVYVLGKRVNNSFTVMGNSSTKILNGDKVKIICKGENIQVYVNDIRLFNINDSFNATATKHGVSGLSDISFLYDNFTITEV